jgi:cellobiose phosphorylase
MIDQLNIDWGQHIVESTVADGIIRVQTRFRPTTSFFASSLKPLGFDTDREVFLGVGRDLSNPAVVERGRPTNTEAPRGNNIGSLCHQLLLQPGQEKEIVYILGVTDQPESIPAGVARYRRRKHVTAAWNAVQADWSDYLGRFTVSTPDPVMNVMLNLWNPIQCRSTLYWSRFVSAYETGTSRGLGTRDSAQDTLGNLHNAPAEAKRTLTMLWQLQHQDGHAWHQVMPLTGEGGPGLAADCPELPQWFCDDHLWLVLAVCAYLRETGDYAYLDQQVRYWDGGTGTVYQHMQRAVDFTLAQRGPRGLPRLGFADWDDTLNLDHGSGQAESVWCAEQFCRVLLDLAELATALDQPEQAHRWRALHAKMAESVNQVAWDGAWYARAYDDHGQPVGVSSEAAHKLNLIPQTWSVIGEVAPRSRARRAMQSVEAKLGSPFGLATLWPAYTEGSSRVRGTATYLPGAKENGGVFCHANTWAIIACAQLGWAERALDYYHRITPLARPDPDVYRTEPYVYCGNFTGPEHRRAGHGRNAWLSGTAAWAYVAATQWILGIRPTLRGLQIEPAIPAAWRGFSARRVFRGVTYDIGVRRRQADSRRPRAEQRSPATSARSSRVRLLVDGQPVKGTIVPLPPPDTTRVAVQVELV